MKARVNQAVWLENQNRWQIKVMRNGIRRTFTSNIEGQKGKRECHRKADEWLASQTFNDATRVGVLLDAWLNELRINTSREHSIQYGGYVRNWIRPIIGARRIGQLNEQHLQDVINNAYSRGKLSYKTLSNIRGALVNFIKFCRKNNCTTLHPESLNIPNGAVVGKRTILNQSDIITLFTCDTEIYYRNERKAWFIHAFRFQVVTGLRPGELIGLEIEHYDGSKVIIRQSINRLNELTDGKTPAARRALLLPPLGIKILDDQALMLAEAGVKSNYIFPLEDGSPATQRKYYTAWDRYKTYHGLSDVSPYELRHTFVSINKTMPTTLKKMIVGHTEDMDTDEVYSHEMDGDLELAANYISAAFERLLN